jgi:glyoxylase-like metal-dependent hydrolase (beta-lactamase superfamily II)
MLNKNYFKVLACLLFVTACAFGQPDSSWKKFEIIPQSQTCFKVYKLRPNIYSIREFADFEDVNCYLVIGERAALLFDTGLGMGNIKTVVSRLTDLPLIVINSHTHYDHINGNYLFDSVMIVKTDYSLHNAKGMSRDDFIPFYKAAYMVSDVTAVHIPADYLVHPFTYKGFITDGENIDLGGITLKIIITTGHAPDAICLLDEKDKLLFSGDTMYKGTIFLHIPGSDFGAYFNAVLKLQSVHTLFDYILPAHGETELSSSCLSLLYKDVLEIKTGKAKFTEKNGVRRYDEGFFKFLTSSPPFSTGGVGSRRSDMH